MESKNEATIARTLRAEQHQNTEAHHEVSRQTLCSTDSNGIKLDVAEKNSDKRSSDSEVSSEMRASRSNKHIVRWAIGSNVCTAALSVVFVCLFTWFIGRPIEAAIGLVPHDTVSAKEMQRDHRNLPILEAENKRLEKTIQDVWKIVDEKNKIVDDKNMQISRMQTKLHYKKETEKVMKGFLTNEKSYLEHALSINPDRENGFAFVDWNPVIVKELLQFALDASHYDVLSWVTEQPGWDTVVSKDLSKKIIRRVNGSSPPKLVKIRDRVREQTRSVVATDQ